MDHLETLIPTGLMDKIISNLFEMNQINTEESENNEANKV